MVGIGPVDGARFAVNKELELRQLRVFLAVVETGAHTRAARALGLAQSTVSETLGALERTLGTALFRKSGKGPLLTASGEALLPHAKKLLALSSELVTELSKISTEVSASLTVATVESVSAYVLPARLAGLRERWPKARLEVITGSCPEIRESVALGKCDLGLTLEAEPGRGDASIEDGSILAAGRLVLFASPAHPLANQSVSPEQLRGFDVYMSDAAGDYHRMLRRSFELAHLPPPRTQALGTVEGVKRAILAGGLALGLLPLHSLAQELRDGSLAEISLSPPLPRLVLRAVYSSNATSSPLVDDLIETLQGSALGA